MSTRSNIAIKVKVEDYAAVSEKIGMEVNDKTPYIQIYSHNDGYPSHMKHELDTYFNNYNKALNLVLAGHTSGIYDGVSAVYTNRGESYEDNAPWSAKYPTMDEEYLYIFENDKWIVDD